MFEQGFCQSEEICGFIRGILKRPHQPLMIRIQDAMVRQQQPRRIKNHLMMGLKIYQSPPFLALALDFCKNILYTCCKSLQEASSPANKQTHPNN